MKYKACIFDLDGTTVDSLEAIAHTANEVLAANSLPVHPIESYKKFVGDGQFELIKRALCAAGDTNLSLYEKAMSEYIRRFETGCIYHIRAYDGIAELLCQLKDMQIKTATLSNKRHNNTLTVVETVFGDSLFDAVLGQMDSYPKKPAPDGALLLCRQLAVKPSECLYIGDTNTDMQTGKAAGMDTVGVTWGFRDRAELEEMQATYIADIPARILDIVQGY